MRTRLRPKWVSPRVQRPRLVPIEPSRRPGRPDLHFERSQTWIARQPDRERRRVAHFHGQGSLGLAVIQPQLAVCRDPTKFQAFRRNWLRRRIFQPALQRTVAGIHVGAGSQIRDHHRIDVFGPDGPGERNQSTGLGTKRKRQGFLTRLTQHKSVHAGQTNPVVYEVTVLQVHRFLLVQLHFPALQIRRQPQPHQFRLQL